MSDVIATLQVADVRGVADAVKSVADRIYLPQTPGALEPMEIAGYMAGIPAQITLFVGQRVGFVAPTMCSRMFATLDHLCSGQVAAVLQLDFMTAKADGLDPSRLAQRTVEYAKIMRDLWAADQPLDHAGEFYRFNKGRTAVPPLHNSMPLWVSGACADVLTVDPSVFDGAIVESRADVADLTKLRSAFKAVLLSDK